MALDLERNRQIIADIENARSSYQHAGDSTGNPLSNARVFLYEQCSLHHTENTQLVKFGSRPTSP